MVVGKAIPTIIVGTNVPTIIKKPKVSIAVVSTIFRTVVSTRLVQIDEIC